MLGNQAGCCGNWAGASCPGSWLADWAADVGRRRELGADPAEQTANEYQGPKLHVHVLYIFNTRLVPSRIITICHTCQSYTFLESKRL